MFQIMPVLILRGIELAIGAAKVGVHDFHVCKIGIVGFVNMDSLCLV